MEKSHSPSDYASIFNRVFDVAVFGTGVIGFSAARRLAQEGAKVAWVDASCDLLWEVSRALENRVATVGDAVLWEAWLNSLREYDGVREGYFDGPLAEIIVAREAQALRENLSTLMVAVPVAVGHMHGGPEGLAAVTVATKCGPRTIRARQWVDATEAGLIAALCQPGMAGRMPSEQRRSVALQSTYWPELEPKMRDFLCDHPEMEWIESARVSERRLTFPSQGDAAWRRQLTGVVHALREVLPEAKVLISHVSLRDFPIYCAAPGGSPGGLESFGIPGNLLVLSPAWNHAPLESVGDRFLLGADAPARLQRCSSVDAEMSDFVGAIPKPCEEVSCEVLVAGTGTAGAIAGIAAARAGAKTVALELASFPGGIGAGGGISIYFHGARGGLQDELDARTAEVSALLGTAPSCSSWHHDAKKLAIRSLFEASDVAFHGETLLCGVERDEAGVVSAVLGVKEGRVIRFRAKAFIDSTGDGDLCALAGAEFVKGRPGDGRTLSFSQVAIFLKKKDGAFSIGIMNYDAGWADATDPEDFTRARLEGVSMHLYKEWSEHDRPFLLAPLLGVRQSRHIITDVQVTMQDLIARAQFDDAVGRAEAIADTHSVDFEFESDDILFYLWVCRSFSHPLRSELPYRMLLPKGLKNVWVACRAAGIAADASYCVRMQRDMQRLGEVAGVAAALSVRRGGDARQPYWEQLHAALEKTGARQPVLPAEAPASRDELLARLDTGESGVHLWALAHRDDAREEMVNRLDAPNEAVSFYAAAVLAFGGNPRAERRLLLAIERRETGLRSDEKDNHGAFGQLIDIPFWLQAVALLRLCGTGNCIPALRDLAATSQPFNVRTLVALSLERLAKQQCDAGGIRQVMDLLLRQDEASASFLLPSRSLWKALKGESQTFAASWGVDTRQDHSWQLHLIAVRIWGTLGLGFPEGAAIYLSDPRTYVREAFRVRASL